MSKVILSATEKRILSAAELERIKSAFQKHSDVARLIKDLRAVRSFRQRQRDQLAKDARALKTGARKSLVAGDRARQKEELFDRVVKMLEERLEALRDTAGAECASYATSEVSKAKDLMDRALTVIEADAKSLFDSNSVNGKLVDTFGVASEIRDLKSLAKDLRTFIKKQ